MSAPAPSHSSAVFLLAALFVASPAVADQPILSVTLENSIPQPGHNGKGKLIRPLVLFVSDWSRTKPRVQACTYGEDVRADFVSFKQSKGHWNATLRYTVYEDPAAQPYSGEATLRLTLHGTSALGVYEGVFNSVAFRGTAEAGLAWDYTDVASKRGMMLWIPDPARPVRALLLWGNGPGLSMKHVAFREDLQAFGAANNVGIVGMDGYGVDMPAGEGAAIDDGLRALAGLSRHPEIETAPILFSGHSLGGQIANRYNAWNPGRVIAFTVSKSGGPQPETVNVESLATPAVLVAGENDLAVRVAGVIRLFEKSRPLGAAWSFEIEEGTAHEFGRSLPLFLIHFQHALDERLRGSKLVPVDRNRAWLADNATWKDAIVKIFPAAGFQGESGRMSWLLDEDVAWVYRGVATYGNPLKLALAGGHGIQYFAGDPVTFQCSGTEHGVWKSVSLYDGAKRVAEIPESGPLITLKDPQKLGVHAGMLVGVRQDGTLRTSLPVAWVMRPALRN